MTSHAVAPPSALVDALSDRYRFEHELGRGGMATVYLARDLRHDRAVAIKVLRPELSATTWPTRFLREIRITAKLDHPSILPLLDSGISAGCLWYAMPLVEGESLRERLGKVGGQLPLPEALGIGRQIAEALDYAHGVGVVHRDIKPENVLLSGERAWVADFGIARVPLGDGDVPITSDSLAIGTPNYMSPEQARGGQAPVDGRSDIYSLGCLLYEMLAGVPPFGGASREAILARHALDPVPPLQTVRSTVGPAADAVFRRMLAKSPADRFGTATEAVTALEASLRQGDTVRRRLIVGTLVAGSALLVALAFLWPAGRLDSHRILVVPLENRGDAQLSGEDIATALADALNTTDSLIASVADPGDSTVSAPWPDSLVTRLGRARHARYVVTGRITADASPRLEMRVRDLTGGSVLFREIAPAGPRDASSIARQVARALLPDLMRPGGALVDDGLLSSDVPAFAAYLQGERAYRRGDYRRADSLFGAALARDSAFAWAALRGAQAANWLTERARAAQFLRVALKKVDSLPPRYGSFARGLSAYGLGQADSAVGHFRRALTLDHRWAEAHLALGEVYQHYLPSTGYPLETAEAAFDSALAYDPGFTAPLFHATQHAIWRGNRSRADSLFRRFSAVVPDSAEERRQLELMRGCLDASSTPDRWQAAARHSMNTAAQAATWLIVAGLRFPSCAKDALDALVANQAGDWTWRYYATIELASLQAALGNVVEVRRLLIELGTSADVMTVLLATTGLPIGDLADTALGRLRQRADSAAGDLSLWAAGTWLIERGDSGAVPPLLNALGRLSNGPDSRRPRLLHASLHARLKLARGDTAAAIEILSRLLPTADQATLRWRPWEALPWERFRLAQLLAARGRLAKAAEVAAAFDSPASFGYLPWLPASLLLREQLERELGDAPYADALQRRHLSLTKGTQGQQQQSSTRR